MLSKTGDSLANSSVVAECRAARAGPNRAQTRDSQENSAWTSADVRCKSLRFKHIEFTTELIFEPLTEVR